jgi:hypothetical protein
MSKAKTAGQEEPFDEVEYYAQRLRDGYQKLRAHDARTVELNFALGRLCLEAKDKLGRGRWVSMFDTLNPPLPFKLTMAERYMAIAQDEVLSDRQWWSVLPSSITALYALSRVDKEILRKALADRRIWPEMTSLHVRDLLPLPEVVEKPDQAALSDDWIPELEQKRLLTALRKMLDAVQQWKSRCPEEDLGFPLKHVKRLAEYIEAGDAAQREFLLS